MKEIVSNNTNKEIREIEREAGMFIHDFCDSHPVTVKTVIYALAGVTLLYGAAVSAKGIPAEF